MRKEIKVVLALGVGLGLGGSAFGAATDFHSQTTDPCAVCHSLSSAKGWVDAGAGTGTNWSGRNGPAKCYTCHQSGNTYGATNQILNAFGNGAASGVHMYSVGTLLPNLDGTAMTMPAAYYVRNIAGVDVNNIDCISCHDVHSRTNRPYLAVAANIENLCYDCHGRTWSGTKASGNVGAGNNTSTNRSTHPQNVAYTFTGNNGEAFPTAFGYRQAGGTTDITKNFGESHPADNDFTTLWNLGGHRMPAAANGAATGAAGNIDCQTCHAVHGGEDYPVDTVSGARQPEVGLAVAPIVGRVAGAAGTTDTMSPVCQACHQGGQGTETVQTAAAGTTKDHPIGVRTLNYMVIDKKTAAGDDDVSSNEGNGNGWTRYWGNDGTDTDVPLCVTCHDIHGGIANTALYRVAATTAADAPGGAVAQTATNWCYTCHGNAAPMAHHSHKGNYTSSQIICEDCHGAPGAGGYQAHGDFFTDFVTVGAAVNAPLPGGGTYSITVAMQEANTNSALCVLCHSPADPTAFWRNAPVSGALTSTPSGAVGTMPARHGNLTRGTSSHQVLRADNNSVGQSGAKYAQGSQDGGGIQPVVNFAPGTYTYVRTGATNVGAYAKWGLGATGNNGTGAAAPAAATQGTDLIICESCHNVQYNYAQYNLSTIASPTNAQRLENGFKTNLLLGLYEDDNPAGGTTLEASNSAAATVDFDGAATDSAFCVACHPFDATTLPHVHGEPNGWADWGGGLEVANNVTNWAGATTAAAVVKLDVYPLAAGFPGNLSWRSGASNNTKFDCDACHRPHNAATSAIVPADGGTPSQPAPLLTEFAGAVNLVVGSATEGNPSMRVQMCENCHTPVAL